MESNKIKELIEGILNILPQNTKDMKDDVKDNLKILLNDYLRKLMSSQEKNLMYKKKYY
jgi:hypothetical protein